MVNARKNLAMRKHYKLHKPLKGLRKGINSEV
jgi:hypothetical protein